MRRNRTERGGPARAMACAGLLIVMGCSPALAEPPIQGPEDAACRAEAKAKVFSAPNPKGLELEQVGRGIYHACMKRSAPGKRGTRGRRAR